MAFTFDLLIVLCRSRLSTDTSMAPYYFSTIAASEQIPCLLSELLFVSRAHAHIKSAAQLEVCAGQTTAGDPLWMCYFVRLWVPRAEAEIMSPLDICVTITWLPYRTLMMRPTPTFTL